MKRVFLLISALLGLAGCGRGKTNLIPLEWTDWKKTTDIELNYPITGHRDQYRRIYINSTGEEVTISREKGRRAYNYPEGTIIVKEIYRDQEYVPGDKPYMFTAMLKAPEHPEAQGGWVWIMRDLNQPEETIVTGEFCFKCHQDANTPNPEGDHNPDNDFRDYVFFPFIKGAE